LGDYDTARVWIAKATGARSEADWSDLDAEGNAFGYSAADWSDVILNFAETAALSHPRYERGDKGLPEIPDMPTRYVPSMPFIKGPARGSARPDASHVPDDVGQYDAAITGQDLDEPAEDVRPKPARTRAKPPKAK
jgi:HemY protein